MTLPALLISAGQCSWSARSLLPAPGAAARVGRVGFGGSRAAKLPGSCCRLTYKPQVDEARRPGPQIPPVRQGAGRRPAHGVDKGFIRCHSCCQEPQQAEHGHLVAAAAVR
jgi:hypothetical protein